MTNLNSTAAQQQQQVDADVRQTSPELRSPLAQVEPPTFKTAWNRKFILFEIIENLIVFLTPSPPRRKMETNFWSDVFVPSRLPARGLFDSFAVHVLVCMAVYAVTLSLKPPVLVQDDFSRDTLTYYTVSDYLPEVRPLKQDLSDAPAVTRKARPAQQDRAADPTYAPQEIISLPQEPEESKQNIVAPTDLKLTRDVSVPNIVSVAPLPNLLRPLEVKQSQSMRTEDVAAPSLSPKITTPIEIVQAHAALPSLAEQPLQIAQGRGVNGPAQLQKQADVAAPRLQVRSGLPNLTADKSTPVLRPGVEAETRSLDGVISAVPVPKAPSQPASTAPAQTAMALSAHPATNVDIPSLPHANRRGAFIAAPSGTAKATGSVATTKALTSADAPTSTTTQTGNQDHGVSIAATSKSPITTGTIVSSADPMPSTSNTNVRDTLLAAARVPPSIPPPRVEPNKPEPVDETARSVFHGKLYYTLTINMPNLSSVAGSWIIRFAELHPTNNKTPLATPVAMSKADPAYPQDLMRDKVEGTVTLYAIIRADGSVSDVRVLHSVDDRLDENAVKAMMRWKFQPGSKDGKPVDVEAVVQVPFRVRKLQF